MASLTLFVRKYFTKTDKTSGRCVICAKNVKSSSNTSNFKKHLASHKIFESVKENIRPAPDNGHSPARKIRRISEEGERITETPKSLGQPLFDESIKKQLSYKRKYCIFYLKYGNQGFFYTAGGGKEATITKRLMYFITKEQLLYRTVDSAGFRVFMQGVAPLYEIPGRKKIKSLKKKQNV